MPSITIVTQKNELAGDKKYMLEVPYIPDEINKQCYEDTVDEVLFRLYGINATSRYSGVAMRGRGQDEYLVPGHHAKEKFAVVASLVAEYWGDSEAINNIEQTDVNALLAVFRPCDISRPPITLLRDTLLQLKTEPYRIADSGGDNFAIKVHSLHNGCYTIHGKNAYGEDRQVTVTFDDLPQGHGPNGEIGYVGKQLYEHRFQILQHFGISIASIAHASRPTYR